MFKQYFTIKVEPYWNVNVYGEVVLEDGKYN